MLPRPSKTPRGDLSPFFDKLQVLLVTSLFHSSHVDIVDDTTTGHASSVLSALLGSRTRINAAATTTRLFRNVRSILCRRSPVMERALPRLCFLLFWDRRDFCESLLFWLWASCFAVPLSSPGCQVRRYSNSHEGILDCWFGLWLSGVRREHGK